MSGDFSISPYDDPVLSLALEQELHPDTRDLVRRLHAAGEHKFADSLEVEAWRRVGITTPELAARLAPVPPRSWIRHILERARLVREEPEPRIW